MSQVQERPPIVTPQMQQYHALLSRHDWQYNFCDDRRAFQAGAASLRKIQELQPTLDPYFDIWNIYAPADKQNAKHSI